MSELITKICDECGVKSTKRNGWLLISALDIRYSNSSKSLFKAEKDIDLCSQGCLLRYIARQMEKASHQIDKRSLPEEPESTDPADRAA